MAQVDRKTVYDLTSIIERCFEESKKMGYIRTVKRADPEPDEATNIYYIEHKDDLVKHIALTIVGELYEFEIIRRIGPILRENRALTHDFLAFGEAFDLFYDKAVQDAQLHGLRIKQEGE